MQRIGYLDGWRGCAILAVLAAHFGTAQVLNLGRFGVELFFVLSGRLMAEILFTRETPLQTFFQRRVTRIYPALAVFVLAMIMTASTRGGDPTFTQYVAALTLTANYAQLEIGRSNVLDHVWSLCTEEHMYLLLGLIAFVHRRRPLPLIGIFTGLAVIGMAIGFAQTAAGLAYNDVYWRTDVRGASLLLGVIAYLVFRERELASPHWRWAPLVLGATGLVLNLNQVPDPVKYSVGTTLLALSLVLMPRAPRAALRILEHPLLLRVGVWSYSIYLWQQPFAKVEGTVAYRLIYLAIAIAVALVSFYGIERPARRLLNRLGRENWTPVSSPSSVSLA